METTVTCKLCGTELNITLGTSESMNIDGTMITTIISAMGSAIHDCPALSA